MLPLPEEFKDLDKIKKWAQQSSTSSLLQSMRSISFFGCSMVALGPLDGAADEFVMEEDSTDVPLSPFDSPNKYGLYNDYE